MTVWDTGCNITVLPLRMITRLGLESQMSKDSDLNFLTIDRRTTTPLGMLSSIQFEVKEQPFVVKAYVVQEAAFDLLIGSSFMIRYAVALFPAWSAIVIARPVLITIAASCQRLPTLSRNDEVVNQEIVPLPEIGLSMTYYASSRSVSLGTSRNLLAQAAEQPLSSQEIDVIRAGQMMTLSVEFVLEQISYPRDLPAGIQRRLAELIIEFADTFSWHELDLGIIEDFPCIITRKDGWAPAVDGPRRLSPQKRDIIRQKFLPFVKMGVFIPAPHDAVDKAQLHVAKRDKSAPLDAATARVYHDYRKLNKTIVPDSYPLDTIPDLYKFMCDRPGKENGPSANDASLFYFTVDADRGYYQIAMHPDSTRATCFEMDDQLWVTNRLVFGILTGPAVFARNADALLGDLKHVDRLVRNYFDDLVGKGTTLDNLLSLLGRVLVKARAFFFFFFFV